MELNVERELAILHHMKTGQLCEKYLEVCGEPPNSRNRGYLLKRIIWRMQANLYGGLSERALQRAKELANPADLRLIMPRQQRGPFSATATVQQPADKRLPMAGTVLTRRYKNQTLLVKVLVDGFEYLGEKHLSLSSVAKAITGSHCNGFLFFKLKGASK